MLPADLIDLMEGRPGHIRRSDPEAARAALGRLGVSPDSQFASFFMAYQVSALSSRASTEELVDLVAPSDQIQAATLFAHQVYGVPARFVCLTSAEGEGFYLYEKPTEAVFDVSAHDIAALNQGSASPRWPDFFAFMRWFLN